MIIEISKPEVLYYIIQRFPHVILNFYVDWSPDCLSFQKTYIDTSRKLEYSSIAFCQINLDLLPFLRELYDINIYKAPCIIFMKNGEIINKLYGNKPIIFQNFTYDFAT